MPLSAILYLCFEFVDDIIITDNDFAGIEELKQYMFKQFQTKDLDKLQYFLGIEIAQSIHAISILQRKYPLDILEEAGMIGFKLINAPMDSNVQLLLEEAIIKPWMVLKNVWEAKLLTITRPDFTFVVSAFSQFLDSLRDSH